LVGSHKKLFSIKAQGANMVVWENACNWAGTPESKLEVRRLNRRNHDNSNILEKFIQFEYLDSLKQPEQNGEKISKTGSINFGANTMKIGWYAWTTWLEGSGSNSKTYDCISTDTVFNVRIRLRIRINFNCK